jgi:hypothetical protein
VLSQISVPYSVPFINFIDLIRNTFYSALNTTLTSFRSHIQNTTINHMKSLRSGPIIIFSSAAIFIDLVLFISITYFRMRLLQLFKEALKFLEKVSADQIKER